jgi:hypothetical protein
MTTTFLQSELWDKIGNLAKRAKRKHIAVAYLGSGACDLIPLHKGDTLVLDMSLSTVKSGQTNPFEVGKYLRAGVSVFNCANLHAKVFVLDGSAVVGSSNVSHHSQDTLVEAGIVTRDQDVVKAARGFIKSIQVERITPEYLRLCKRLYNPPRFGNGHLRKRTRQKVQPTYSRLWIAGISDIKFSEEENRISDRETRKALKEVKNTRRYEVNTIRWTGDSHFTREVRKGDLIIQLYHKKAYPPARVVRITKYRLPNRKQARFLICVEDEKRPKLFAWSKFKKQLSQVSLGKLTLGSTREIKTPTASHSILGMWS